MSVSFDRAFIYGQPEEGTVHIKATLLANVNTS